MLSHPFPSLSRFTVLLCPLGPCSLLGVLTSPGYTGSLQPSLWPHRLPEPPPVPQPAALLRVSCSRVPQALACLRAFALSNVPRPPLVSLSPLCGHDPLTVLPPIHTLSPVEWALPCVVHFCTPSTRHDAWHRGGAGNTFRWTEGWLGRSQRGRECFSASCLS